MFDFCMCLYDFWMFAARFRQKFTRICLRKIKELYTISSRFLWGFCKLSVRVYGRIWGNSFCKISARLLSVFCTISVRFLKLFCKMSVIFLEDFCRLSVRFLQAFYRISARILYDFCKISASFLYDLCKIYVGCL